MPSDHKIYPKERSTPRERKTKNALLLTAAQSNKTKYVWGNKPKQKNKTVTDTSSTQGHEQEKNCFVSNRSKSMAYLVPKDRARFHKIFKSRFMIKLKF